jgi:hypothetical protein
VSNLRVIKPEGIGSSVIEALENTLAMAKEGRLSSVAIAYVERDGSTGQTISDMPHQAAQIGATAIMLTHLTAGAIGAYTAI